MSRIPQHFIDELLNRVDIVDVVDSRVKLKKTGKNYVACCPFHKEKTPSFTVSPDKQFYYCFGCGATGTAISFAMEFDHIGFVDAIENLSRTVGIEVPRERSEQPVRSYKNLYTILEKAKLYYEKQLKENPKRKEAVTYLQNRGLTGHIAKAFGLGYAPPGWDNLIIKLGLNEEDNHLLDEAGLTVTSEDSQKRYDRFRHRIMFPIIDVRGRVIGFGGRILESATLHEGKPKGGPKYLNSPETPVFQKGRELYGLYQAKQNNRKLERLVVVEGYMDVIALAQYNISYAVATLGTACGEDHLNLSFRHTNEVVFCFDGDKAGRNAAKRALENSLPAMQDGRHVKFLFLPEGQDPDTLVRQIGKDRFEAQIKAAIPLEDFFFEAVAEGVDARTMEGRAKISKLAAPLLNTLPQGVFRGLMFDQLAKRTGLDSDVLQELISNKVSLVSGEPQANSPPLPETSSQPTTIKAPSPAFVPRQQIHPSRAIKLNPAKTATTLLLENPSLAHEQNLDLSLPEDENTPDLNLLKRLLNFIQPRPNSSFHSILGYWGGQYGLEAQKELAELVANQFLGSAQKGNNYNAQKELTDAFYRIRQEAQLKNQDREISELMQQEALTSAQKDRLKNLLKSKAQTKLMRE